MSRAAAAPQATGPASFLWHDYETFGADPRRDDVAQFAAQRTDAALEPVGEPIVLFCKPGRLRLPSPEACLITGITPQQAEREGVIETEFAASVSEAFAEAGTCGAGYNSLRFDDEVTRHLFWRNYLDPYAREWRNGNSRWDLIDVVRMCYALRPDGFEWPLREDGSPSFRLEQLTTANGIGHTRAHDALSDVEATIALARLVRTRQRRLFDYTLSLRDKRRAMELLDPTDPQPLIHVSSRFPAERGCLALVVPLVRHPVNSNAVIVFDLSGDPATLETLDADEIADRVFVSNADLPEDVSRIPLKAVHANRSPMLAPVSTLRDVNLARIRLDPELCLANAQRLRAIPDLARKIAAVFERTPTPADLGEPESQLYGGSFLTPADQALARKLRTQRPEKLGALHDRFLDGRLNALLTIYRARNYPETLDPLEREQWAALRTRRLIDSGAHQAQQEALALLRALHAEDPRALGILAEVERWTRMLCDDLDGSARG